MNSLVAELSNVAMQERELLSQCKDLLSTAAALRVRMTSCLFHNVFTCPPDLNQFEYFKWMVIYSCYLVFTLGRMLHACLLS